MNFVQEDIHFISETAAKLGFMDKSFLVTGSTGLIGNMLVKSLSTITDPKNIVIVSSDIEKSRKHWEKYTFIFCSYEELNNLHKVDYIIHLASPTNSSFMTNKPIETISFIYESTKQLLDYAHKNNAKFLYVSSMEVYGVVFDNIEKSEDDLGHVSLLNTRSSYPESKRLCELLSYSYYKEFGTQTYVARLAQSFGAGVNYEEPRIFGYLGRCAAKKEDIVLKTRGESIGNYCYLAEAITSFFYILSKGDVGETYNVVGDNMRFTILELASIVAKNIANNSIKVLFDINDNEIYPEPTKLYMNNKKIKLLGWTPSHTITSCFERMIGGWQQC